MARETLPSATVEKLGPVACSLQGPALLTVISGELRVECSGSGTPDPGDLVRLEPQDVLAISRGRRAELIACGASAEVIRIEIAASWAERVGALVGVEAGCCSVLPLFVERGGTTAARRVDRLLKDLVVPPEERCTSDVLRDTSKVLELLALLFEERRQVLEPGARRGRSRRAAFLRAVERLPDEPLDDLTIETFARDLGCSARQVSRLFREELGTTFRDHLVELRLARAKDLLERTPLNVIDVAGATGWSSLAHFNAVFRRHVGATPTGYRARFRAESGA